MYVSHTTSLRLSDRYPGNVLLQFVSSPPQFQFTIKEKNLNLVGVIFVDLPMPPDKGFQFGEEHLNRIQIGRIWAQIHQLTPAYEHIWFNLSERLKEALSITRIDFGSGHLPQ